MFVNIGDRPLQNIGENEIYSKICNTVSYKYMFVKINRSFLKEVIWWMSFTLIDFYLSTCLRVGQIYVNDKILV